MKSMTKSWKIFLKLHGLTSMGSCIFWRWSASPPAAPLLSTNAAVPEKVRRGWLFIYSEWIQPGLVAGFILILGFVFSFSGCQQSSPQDFYSPSGLGRNSDESKKL